MHRHKLILSLNGAGKIVAHCEYCPYWLETSVIERRLNEWEDFERLKKKYDALEREVSIMVSGPWDGDE